ncbi:MAG: fasciclin domain-containing protein, partial [Terrimicrobiaceae bacterium]
MKKVAFIAAALAAYLQATPQNLLAAQEPTIVNVAAGAGQFNTLVAAVKAAGLVETLNGKGPFTVFAPTDEAFAKLPKGTVENLLKPENKDKLTAILTYHVVPGRVTASEVVTLSSAPTVNGRALDISTQ